MKAFRPVAKRRNKYGAVRTNGYASKAEAAYADLLALQQRAGIVVGWLEQVPIRLPGGIKYLVDFQVFYKDGRVRFVEVKGFETQTWKIKIKLIEHLMPWVFERLEIVR